ncbi:Hsp33 family molecular chaperone [Bartonella tamiae]|uniref:Hsp33-like chaperonin n=1 Tax=Bartonella tamiae Th239 TaxID=1094558 RepID=J1K289_9HYPH|nr:Hsp33 family molecular chaperone [Bartonella tamiae]EJF91225.1 hypothetical protein ME5_00557 [Bartonella tamiae Th239]EJF93110.1 hypothetical protein MEG_01324 [Bartonella tamiae Th307]
MSEQFGKGEDAIRLGDFHFAGDDAVVPFEVQGLDARGRSVQLGAAVNSILERHNYPEPVSRLLAEALVLTVLLGTSLKFDGKFIFQTSSDGPVNLLVCDFQTPSQIRGYARFDEERLKQAISDGQTAPEQLLGQGTLALTVDQGSHMQRYQGIVALDGSNLEEIARNYFLQSEQIPTDIRLAVATLFDRDEQGAPKQSWRAGGMLTQFLPQSSFHEGENEKQNQQILDDHWREVIALTHTVESAEMTDPHIGAERLLFRLFHEHGVRVFDATPIIDRCSCSREKIENVLIGFNQDELQESIEDGEITVSCEFCSSVYHFDPDKLGSSQNNDDDKKNNDIS